MKAYLGDGAYVEWREDIQSVMLTTENGIEVTNMVFLGLKELDLLFNFVDNIINEENSEYVGV